ncbi:N-acetylmannosamine-6-phosphate 2-epimerase [Mycoplasmatota bacterium]|nr:N-acetylmannosamine-6-phosphate 2-epimerase [Mycoplasmatota bacterium]
MIILIRKILKPGLIVSCQALEDEPLHSSKIMARMAVAAQMGGAVAIRANSGKDIKKIRKEVNIPIIGLVKKDYPDSEIYITPTMKEVKEVVKAGADIIAVDATDRLRPNSVTLDEFYKEIKKKYPDIYLMADVSTFEEGIKADELGFDLISTTLSGYTSYTSDVNLPNIRLVEQLSKEIKNAVLTAEGGIWSSEDLKKCMEFSYSAVIGSAITRPQLITKHYVDGMKKIN